MKQAIKSISIKKPCQQLWQQMPPNDHGRHCESCAKTVVDFTSLTDIQLVAYLLTHSNICGRFSETQLDRINLQFSEQATQHKTAWKKWVMTMALLCSTTLYKVSGQTTAVKASKVEQNLSESHPANSPLRRTAVNQAFRSEIKGRIFDSANMPLHGATIRVFGTDIVLPTDTEGKFKFHAPILAKQFTVSFVGFDTETVDIDGMQSEFYEVKLTPHIVSMNDVMVVTGYSSRLRTDLVGSITVVTAAEMTKKHCWLWRIYYKYIRTPIHQIFH